MIPASGAVGTDSDGVLHNLMYVQVRLQTFAIRAAEMVDGRPIPAWQVPGNQAWIDFAGPPGTYRTYSMADVLDGAVPSSAFAGKIVLVGVTAPVGKDVFSTAASPDPMSGVEVQANAMETVLRGFPLRSAGAWLSAVLIIALALAPVALGLRASSLIIVLSAPVLAAVFLALAVLTFDHGLILPVPAPIVALIIATGGAVAAARGAGGPLRRAERVHGRGDHQPRSDSAAGDTRGHHGLPGHAGHHRQVLARGSGRRRGARAGWTIPATGSGAKWRKVSPGRKQPSSRSSPTGQRCRTARICRRAFSRCATVRPSPWPAMTSTARSAR